MKRNWFTGLAMIIGLVLVHGVYGDSPADRVLKTTSPGGIIDGLQDKEVVSDLIQNYSYPQTAFKLKIDDAGTGVIITSYNAVDENWIIIVPATIEGYPVVGIGDGAFRELKKVQAVVLPETITSIGEDAFRECSALYAINWPEDLKTIGSRAFFGCQKFFLASDINLPEGLQWIGIGTFYGCGSSWTITIPGGVKRILRFSGNFRQIILSEGVEMIDNNAFEDNKNLARITFPASLKQIEHGAFSGCTNLTDIVIPDNADFSFQSTTFDYCPNLKLSVQKKLQDIANDARRAREKAYPIER